MRRVFACLIAHRYSSDVVSSTARFVTATHTAARVHVTWYEQVAEPLNRLQVEQKVGISTTERSGILT